MNLDFLHNPHQLKIIALADILIAVTIISVYFKLLTPENWLAGVTFILFFSMLATIVIFWEHRIPILLLTIGLLFFMNVMRIDVFIEYARFDVIAFLIGMMIIVAFLEDRGFFDVLLSLFMSRFGKNAKTFVAGTLIISALAAAIVDEVTSVLFMTTMVLKVTKKYNVSPVPYILSVVFATNVGSTFTVIGNPVGVLIAFEAKLSFIDFLVWAFPIGLAVLALTILIILGYFKKELAELDRKMRQDVAHRKRTKNPRELYIDFLSHREMWIPLSIFLFTIIGLMVHHTIEEAFHLEPNSLLLGIPIFAAALSLIQGRRNSLEVIERRIEWPTLVFFIFFFASVGALEVTQITAKLGSVITEITGGDMTSNILLFTLSSGFLSAFMANILVVATFSSIISTLPGNVFPLWWAILFGSCYMGNLTIIGSSANVIAADKLRKEKNITITFMEWLKPGIVIALCQTFLAILLTILVHVYLFPR
ncbi:MAG: SLC13 family permease [Thermoplasmata archaeon]